MFCFVYVVQVGKVAFVVRRGGGSWQLVLEKECEKDTGFVGYLRILTLGSAGKWLWHNVDLLMTERERFSRSIYRKMLLPPE
ncbi:unnamed protein product, partial [Ilex paraguariensis]